MQSLKIILLSTAFNGLTQRAWLDLRQSGHRPSVVLFTNEEDVCRQIEQADADLVICPFLKDRVPEQLWRHPTRPVIIIHPGIVGDRGASALDWAISNNLERWGVTALQAVEEMDAGPVWSTWEFKVPAQVRKSELYNGPVADAAIYCIRDVVEKFGSDFVPVPLDYSQPQVRGRLQPNMKQDDRSFSWHDSAAFIKRCIDAADGQPGVLASLAGGQYYLYDAHLDSRSGTPASCWRCTTMRCWWPAATAACGSAPSSARPGRARNTSSCRPAMCWLANWTAFLSWTGRSPASRSATRLTSRSATASRATSAS